VVEVDCEVTCSSVVDDLCSGGSSLVDSTVVVVDVNTTVVDVFVTFVEVVVWLDHGLARRTGLQSTCSAATALPRLMSSVEL
jgi:hypothetical protein